MARVRIGDMLVAAGLLTPEKLARALEIQAEDGRRVGDILVAEGWVTEVQLVQILSQQLSVPWASLHHVDFSRQLLNLVPRALAERYCLLPIYVRHQRDVGDTLYVAMDDPTNDEALGEVEVTSGLAVRPMIAPPSDIRSAIRVYYGGEPAPSPRSNRPPPSAEGPKASAIPPLPPARLAAPPEAPSAERGVVAPPASPPPAAPPRVSRPSPPPAPPLPRDTTPDARGPSDGAEPTEIAREPPAREPSAVGGSSATDAHGPAHVSSPVEPIPTSRRPKPMVTLTLLDGTKVQLPRTPPKKKQQDAPPDESLTARDLVAALRAASHDADVSDVLPDKRWESMFAALLAVLLRKHLIADWEFVEEWKRS